MIRPQGIEQPLFSSIISCRLLTSSLRLQELCSEQNKPVSVFVCLTAHSLLIHVQAIAYTCKSNCLYMYKQWTDSVESRRSPRLLRWICKSKQMIYGHLLALGKRVTKSGIVYKNRPIAHFAGWNRPQSPKTTGISENQATFRQQSTVKISL